MRCVACGKNSNKPVWAIYGDEAFANKQQDSFPLCGTCFKTNQYVVVTEWEPLEELDFSTNPRTATHEETHKLVEKKIERYVRVVGPEEEADG